MFDEYHKNKRETTSFQVKPILALNEYQTVLTSNKKFLSLKTSQNITPKPSQPSP